MKINSSEIKPIKYTEILQKKVFKCAPFVRYMEMENLIPSFNKNSTNMEEYKIIDYTENIGDGIDFGNDLEIDRMLYAAGMMDEFILNSNIQNKNVDNLISSLKTNTKNLSGKKLILEDIFNLIDNIVDNSGFPSLILTTANVGRQFNELYEKGDNNIFNEEIELGIHVNKINYLNKNIPVIIDSNIDRSNGEQLIIFSNSSVRIKPLFSLSKEHLNKMGLNSKKVICSNFNFHIRKENRNGLITGIGSI